METLSKISRCERRVAKLCAARLRCGRCWCCLASRAIGTIAGKAAASEMHCCNLQFGPGKDWSSFMPAEKKRCGRNVRDTQRSGSCAAPRPVQYKVVRKAIRAATSARSCPFRLPLRWFFFTAPLRGDHHRSTVQRIFFQQQLYKYVKMHLELSRCSVVDTDKNKKNCLHLEAHQILKVKSCAFQQTKFIRFAATDFIATVISFPESFS